MNALQHTRNERNPWLKQNRPDRSYRDTLLTSDEEGKGGHNSIIEPYGGWDIFRHDTTKIL